MVHQATEYYAGVEEQEDGLAQRVLAGISFAMQAAGRLAFPVIALLGVFLWADSGTDQAVRWFDAYFDVPARHLEPSYWLTFGHIVLPLIFLVVNLTSRRYGPSYATAQVVIVWGLLGGLAYYFLVQNEAPLVTSPLPDVRTCMAFVVSLLFAQFISISLFDWTRGNPWWRAPLYASLWGGFAFCVTFYPAARLGLGLPWVNEMVTYFGYIAGVSFLMLSPYYLARKFIKPLAGYGGA